MPIRKKYVNLSYAPRIYIYIYIYIEREREFEILKEIIRPMVKCDRNFTTPISFYTTDTIFNE